MERKIKISRVHVEPEVAHQMIKDGSTKTINYSTPWRVKIFGYRKQAVRGHRMSQIHWLMSEFREFSEAEIQTDEWFDEYLDILGCCALFNNDEITQLANLLVWDVAHPVKSQIRKAYPFWLKKQLSRGRKPIGKVDILMFHHLISANVSHVSTRLNTKSNL